MTTTDIGIDVSGKVIDLTELQAELVAGGVPLPRGLTIAAPPQEFDPNAPMPPPGQLVPQPPGARLFTYDEDMQPSDLPSAADDIVAGYTVGEPEDPLLELRTVTVGTSSGRLRDALVKYLEKHR